jgi:hypothetical protein
VISRFRHSNNLDLCIYLNFVCSFFTCVEISHIFQLSKIYSHAYKFESEMHMKYQIEQINKDLCYIRTALKFDLRKMHSFHKLN